MICPVQLLVLEVTRPSSMNTKASASPVPHPVPRRPHIPTLPSRAGQMSLTNVPQTYGALLLGGLFASSLSGIVAIQTIAYFRAYPSDPRYLKALVFIIWILDLCHSGLVFSSIWTYLITGYGNVNAIEVIPLTIALTVIFTAALTFLVHCFFMHRIFLLSQRNWYIVCPIVLLAVFRICSACVTAGKMVELHTLSEFKGRFHWVFTLGLALSSTVDVLITISLFLLLQTSRSASTNLNRVIDSLILYAFENGSLTCAATIVSMICWLSMTENMIFMGLYFVIGKMYANSLLVTLNTREKLRRAQSAQGDVLVLDTRRNQMRAPEQYSPTDDSSTSSKTLKVNVEKIIQYDRDRDLESLER